MAELSSHVSYDDLPYDGGCTQATHPARMAAMGRLFGMEPAPVETARVLELGCGGGSNIIPMAYGLPGAEFVAIDLAPRHIEMAAARAAALGIANLGLETMDVRDAVHLEGQFDYIICHGVYSWVPQDVREAILEVLRRKLRPQGIGFISYNALPGWHLRNAVRDMMVYHGRYFPELEERAVQARALVDFVADATELLAGQIPGIGIHQQAMAAARGIVSNYPDYYVVHEFLESDNEAFYLFQFVDQLERAGVQYLGDSSLAAMVSHNLPTEIAQTLDLISVTNVALEQYRDFLVNRTFRNSLVCQQGVALTRELAPQSAFHLWYRANNRRENAVDESHISGADGRTVEIGSEDAKRVLGALWDAYPGALSYAELHGAIGGADMLNDDDMGRLLLSLQSYALFDVFAAPPAVCAPSGGNPAAWPPAVLYVREGGAIPAPAHQALSFDQAARTVLGLLDGTRTMEQLSVDAFTALTGTTLTFETDAGTIAAAELSREQSDTVVLRSMEAFRAYGILGT